MSDKIGLSDASKLLRDLQSDEALRHRRVAGAELAPEYALLRAWQSERLARTYADLLADAQYRPACLFFLSDIYAPRDFSQRDHDLERIHALTPGVAPQQVRQLLANLVELNRLSNQLDEQLVRALVDQLGVTDAITPEQYAEAYRVCDNYPDRVRQIDLIAHAVTQVGTWARLPMIGVALKIMSGPVRQMGWVEVQDFLERGYAAFRQMRDVSRFVSIVETREKRILDQIYARAANPFAV